MLHWSYSRMCAQMFSAWHSSSAHALFSQGTLSSVLKLKPSVILDRACWVRIDVNLGFPLFSPVLVCTCQAHGWEKSDLTSHSKIWHKIPVLLVRKGYINQTKTLETRVTQWKSAQNSLSSPAFGLSPSLPFSWTSGWGEVSLQQSHSSPPSACCLWILFPDKYKRTSVFFQFVSSPPRAKSICSPDTEIAPCASMSTGKLNWNGTFWQQGKTE